ncbi:helix-turn-helix domain-containing protein [Hyphobacterium sp. SN044]|uniref:GlxA family transcriptional regulator n=1 Tax=Hyphobacterium sp. SN044 TaxID=2912575 RepID=UPI001F016B1A|nr:helix-turn-helix domain-containing protein [Hyphobacterium sp. SN044]MCF8879482.1 helix-turn-helix domain-containing protein [Hyphobacterium sp. SN044]
MTVVGGRPVVRRIGFFLYEGMAASDILWEVDMFRLAPVIAQAEGLACPEFETVMIGLKRGPVATWSGYSIFAERSLSEIRTSLDLIYVGSAMPELQKRLLADTEFRSAMCAIAASGCRLVAVGSAAMIFADLGLLDGRRATVHSVAADAFRDAYPEIEFEADPLWVEDGPIVTTAGSMPAVEFTLEVIERECGRAMSFAIAKAGLLPMRRGASQSRLSAALVMQMEASDRFDGMLQWLSENLHVQISVTELSDLAGMSPRNFARRFVERTGSTPARFVETLRAERARQLMETTQLPLVRIAERSGLRNEQGLRRALRRVFGKSPVELRAMVRRPGSTLAESEGSLS